MSELCSPKVASCMDLYRCGYSNTTMSTQSLYNVATALSRLTVKSPSVCLSCRIAQQPFRAPPQRQLLPTIQARNASHAAAGVANGPKNRPGRRLGAKRGNGTFALFSTSHRDFTCNPLDDTGTQSPVDVRTKGSSC